MRTLPQTLRVTEIFHSIQGESSHAGRPCVFVRLTGCGLRCRWCDTPYAFGGGEEMTINEVLARVSKLSTPLVEITGGEPMEQESVYPLMRQFLDEGYTVMLETGGHVSLARVPQAVIKIIDVKCPDSGECGTFAEDNLRIAAPHDEFKFVISSRGDYEWARDFFNQNLVSRPHTTLFSPTHGVLDPRSLSEWVLADRLSVRIQLQIHKHIWDPKARSI